MPILDFIHGLSYVFASALAGHGFKEGWAVYERWIQWVWSGAVDKVIAAYRAEGMDVQVDLRLETFAAARHRPE